MLLNEFQYQPHDLDKPYDNSASKDNINLVSVRMAQNLIITENSKSANTQIQFQQL